LLVVTSNRGLCGAYNGNVLRTATRAMREATRDMVLEVVGKKGLGYFRYAGREVSRFHGEFGDQPSFRDVEALADRYMAEFTAGQYDRVSLAYMAFESVARQKPQVMTLLPLQPPAPPPAPDGGDGKKTPGSASGTPTSGGGGTSGGGVLYEYSPEPTELLAELLPVTVRAQLFQCFNEAVVGEQVARMVAMKAATDAAGKMGKRLNRKYNRARQTAITTELTEIIGGAAALA
jgi:F-type H+-transporting ATPase subunit gamma